MIPAVVLVLAALFVVPQGERVPDAAVVSGVPQGLFVGRSLLSGKAVCLLFLSGGRITRAIPEGGLENFDWNRHRAAHGPDSGTWQMRGTQLVVTWGDGGIHQGPITVHPDGIEFYGKRYAKPAVVGLPALAGRWEAARGTAIAGGQGVNRVSELVIQADGRYQWVSTTGGTVAGRAVASDRSMTGQATVNGLTIIFTSDAGSTSSHTLLPAGGTPVNALSVDSDMFTRSEPALAVTPNTQLPAAGAAAGPPSSSNSYQGLSFTTPQGWRSGMQQGRFVLAPAAAAPDGAVLVVIEGAADLGGKLFGDWFRAVMAAELARLEVVQTALATRGRSGALETLSAGRTVRDPSGTVVLQVYYAISDAKRAGVAMVATTSEAALRAQMSAVQALFQSVRFSDTAAGASREPAPPTAPGGVPERATTASSDLVGHWDHASSNRIVAPAPADAAKGYAQGYTFSADGTYTYAFTGMIDRAHFNESDAGTWAIQNGALVVRSRERNSTKTYQIVQFRAALDGSATMTLLLADYPPTVSNINVWGEKYVRKAR